MTNIILIAVPSITGLIWLCYKDPAKAQVLVYRIHLILVLPLAALDLVLFIIGMTLMYTERIIKEEDDKKILQDIIDSISHYIFGLMLVIISLWIIFYLLKQLSIYFEVDESKPNDTNSA